MGRKRRVGKRAVKVNGTFRETGFSTEAAFAQGNHQVDAVEREIARQDAQTNAVLDRSNKARQKMADAGLFGGLN